MPLEVPSLTVADAVAWRRWLSQEAEVSKGVWLTLAKKGNTKPTSLTYPQALDEALCYGWIDGQARGGDDVSYSQRYTPRTAKSMWSQRNVIHTARLENDGHMQPRGRLEIEKAKTDGRWDAAYGGQSNIEPPAYLTAAIEANPAAQAQWDILTKQNRFAIIFRLANLKTEAGREKRLHAFVDMLARGESLHPQKQALDKKKAPNRPSKAVSRIEKSTPADTSLRRSGRVKQTSTPS